MTNSVCARLAEFARLGSGVISPPELAAHAFRIIARGKSLSTEVPEYPCG